VSLVGSDKGRVLKGINIGVSDEELAYVGSGAVLSGVSLGSG